MAMSKKHHERIAVIINEERRRFDSGGALEPYKDLVHRLAAFFASDNSKFDTSRFLRACGVKE